jgi:hypothetical protein
MKTNMPHMIMSLLLVFVFAAGLRAQDKTEVSIQVRKDGKVVKDTTYLFEDDKEAKNVLKMVDVMSGMDEDMEDVHYNYTMTRSGGEHGEAMIFITKDGDKTEIKEIHGDSLVWISEEDGFHGEHKDGDHVVIIKKEDGETFDILVDEDGSMDGKKRVKVVVSEDDRGSWTAVSAEDTDRDEDIYILKGDDDLKEEMKKIMEKYDGVEGANVKVIVTKKKVKKDK